MAMMLDGLHFAFLTFLMIYFQGMICGATQTKNFSSPIEYRPISNLAFDSKNGFVYIGGKNAIFRTTVSLELLEKAVTGPVNDSLYADGKEKRMNFDNHNELLLLMDKEGILLVCGTGNAGNCELRNQSNIQQIKSKENFLYFVTSTYSFNRGIVTQVNGRNVLFIASNFSSNPNTNADQGDSDVYFAIAARNMQNLRETIPEYSVQLKNTDTRNSFPVSYRAVLRSGNYLYFISNQNHTFARIAKMCLKSGQLFEEIPITCSSGYPFFQHGEFISLESGKQVLFALFSDFENHKNTLASGVICLYTEDDILDAFKASRIDLSQCPPRQLNEDDLIYKSSFTGPAPTCDPKDKDYIAVTNLISNRNFCNKGKIHLYSYIQGFKALLGVSQYKESKTQFTMVTSRVVNGLSEVFVGTSNGNLIKFFVWRDGTGKVKLRKLRSYPKVTSTGIVDLKNFGGSIYAASGSIVIKFPEESCSNYNTCESCMGVGAAKCGWCVISQRCTEANSVSCPNFGGVGMPGSDLWLPSVKGMCTQIQFSTKTEEGVKVEELSKPGGNKKFTFTLMPSISTQSISAKICRINSKTAAIVEEGNMLQCEFSVSDLGKTPGKHVLEVILSGTKVASKELLFYNCSNYRNCHRCQEDPRTSCSWCTKEAWCMESSQDCNGANASNLEECPMVKKDIVKLPVNEKRNLAFTLMNLGNIPEIRYSCEVAGKSYTASMSQNDTLVCKDVGPYSEGQKVITFFYTGTKGKVTLNSIKTADGGIRKENSYIEVYSCPNVLKRYAEYDGDCSTCNYLKQAVKYDCTWCGGTCSHKCGRTEECGYPQIRRIDPVDGPLGGNTELTISGINLGTGEHELNSVIVAGISCLDLKYVKRNVTCRTNLADRAKTGAVEISVNNKRQTNSVVKFSYKMPRLNDMNPKSGIRQGGTKLTIKGTSLQIGNKNLGIQMVSLGHPSKGKECKKESVSETEIICSLEQNQDPVLQPHILKVTFDGDTTINLTSSFMYLENPVVKETVPKNLVSIRSGGTKFKVIGERLTVATEMYVRVENERKDCVVDGEDKQNLLCEFPPTPSDRRRRRKRDISQENDIQPQTMVLHLDGWSRAIPDENRGVNYVSDPVVVNLSKPFTYDPSKDSPLILRGYHLTLVLKKKEDYSVTIGNADCFITMVENNNITCRPPRKKPQPADGDGDKLYIRVKVAKLTMKIGTADYADSVDSTIIIIVVLLIVILVAAVLCVYVVYKMRQKNKMEIDKMMMEMKEWEDKTKEDGKEEFADMQLTIMDIRNNMVTSGIPYLDYQTFIIRALFPALNKSSTPDFLLRNAKVSDEVGAALDSFEKLLSNKYFVKGVIDTLEKQNQRRIALQDKAHISSLLTIVLMGKMKTYFEILECLLTSLVEDTNKKQHRILFNRFDTFTMRLLINWLNVALYPYLKDHGGTSLFMLYRAIETVVEKRPVDDITGDAKNTLSQDSFLKEKVEFKAVKLMVDLENLTNIHCEVLDCDTISQVKRKCIHQIYRNRPASQMPSADDMKLVWKMGQSGKLVLNDIDHTSQQDGDSVKMNTLKHYNVKDDSRMVLSYKYSPDDNREQIGACDRGSFTPPVSPTDVNFTEKSILLSEEAMETMNKWHLVRDVDEDRNTLNRKQLSKGHLKEGLYITSLVHTKLILLEYIKALFENMLDTNHFPPVVHYLFDTLATIAENNSVDAETLQCWKSECYAIRIWATLLASPNHLFDIDRIRHVDSCLDSVRQVLMDCVHSTKITKESSLQKLLFATEVPQFQKNVEVFYKTLSEMDSITETQFNDEMRKLSGMQKDLQFQTIPVLLKLFKTLQPFMDDILDDLDACDDTKDLRFREKMGNIMDKMSEESACK